MSSSTSPATSSSDPSSSPRTFTFYPTKQKGYTKKVRVPINPWRAPEHEKLTKDMKRDFPRDDFGRPLRGMELELQLDRRPTILKQE